MITLRTMVQLFPIQHSAESNNEIVPNAAESNGTIVSNSAESNGAIAPNSAESNGEIAPNGDARSHISTNDTRHFPNQGTRINGGNHTGAFSDMRRGNTAEAEQSSMQARDEVLNRKLDSLQRDVYDIKKGLDKLLGTLEKLIPQAQV